MLRLRLLRMTGGRNVLYKNPVRPLNIATPKRRRIKCVSDSEYDDYGGEPKDCGLCVSLII